MRRPGAQLLETTVGRIIFNSVIPDELGYINKVADKKTLSSIVDECYRKLGFAVTSVLLDGFKTLGFKYATRAGITIGVSDIIIPEQKKDILIEAEQYVEKVELQYRRGLITEDNHQLFRAWHF